MEQFVVSARKYRPHLLMWATKPLPTLYSMPSRPITCFCPLFTLSWCGENYLRKDFGEKINQPGYDDPNEISHSMCLNSMPRPTTR
jgi:hypothetical protein